MDQYICETNSELKRGIDLLRRSYDYALDCKRSKWDFAVEVDVLIRLGMTTSDFRWLCCKGYVEHRREVGLPGAEGRQFGEADELTMTSESCFVLTEDGADFAETLNLRYTMVQVENCRDDNVKPKWDADRHVLSVGEETVKCFKLPSPNQEMVLAAFEEEGWPVRICDPLPPAPEIDPKRRLQDTIKSLNRCQKSSLLRFAGDGTGEGVLWERSAAF